jgi:hypothetical protein
MNKLSRITVGLVAGAALLAPGAVSTAHAATTTAVQTYVGAGVMIPQQAVVPNGTVVVEVNADVTVAGHTFTIQARSQVINSRTSKPFTVSVPEPNTITTVPVFVDGAQVGAVEVIG